MRVVWADLVDYVDVLVFSADGAAVIRSHGDFYNKLKTGRFYVGYIFMV